MTDATSAIKKVMAPGADQEHGAALFDLNAESVATRCAPAGRQRVSPMPCPRAMRRLERRHFTTRWFAVVSQSAPAAADAPPRSSRFRRRTRSGASSSATASKSAWFRGGTCPVRRPGDGGTLTEELLKSPGLRAHGVGETRGPAHRPWRGG